MQCPKCNKADVRPSKRIHLMDLPQRLRGLSGYRCRGCGSRFYGQLDPKATWIARAFRAFHSHRERERIILRFRYYGVQMFVFGCGLVLFIVFLNYMTRFGS